MRTASRAFSAVMRSTPGRHGCDAVGSNEPNFAEMRQEYDAEGGSDPNLSRNGRYQLWRLLSDDWHRQEQFVTGPGDQVRCPGDQ